MSKNGFTRLLKAAAVAALFVPYRYEKTDDGFTVASVLVKVQYHKDLTPTELAEAPENTTGKTVISVPGILDEQVEAVKALWAKGSTYVAEKRDELLSRAVERQNGEPVENEPLAEAKEAVAEAKEALADAKDAVAEKAKEIKEKVEDAAKNVAGKVEEKVKDVKETVSDAVRDVDDTVKNAE